MFRKNTLHLILGFLLVTLLLFGCTAAPGETSTTSMSTVAEVATTADESEATEGELILTLEELSEFNGKNGNRAYVAVNGIIYDVTDSARWKNGGHNGFEAGNDLTDAIMTKSPHGLRTLNNVPAIGKLAD
jgi:predicted heme/steroid binding protein